MKSGKQRRAEIKAARISRARKLAGDIDVFNGPVPKGAVLANHQELIHNSYWVDRPPFYTDKPFECRDCGAQQIWTAKQQLWWFEIAKGRLEAYAVRCRKCRDRIKAEKDAQRSHMEAMAERKPHPNEAFFKNT